MLVSSTDSSGSEVAPLSPVPQRRGRQPQGLPGDRRPSLVRSLRRAGHPDLRPGEPVGENWYESARTVHPVHT